MIKELRFINSLNESLSVVLTEGEPAHGLLISSITGISPVNANINTTDLAIGDGSKKNSAKLVERNIVLKFMLTGTDVEASRQLCYRIFQPKKSVRSQFITDHRNVAITGWVESNEPDIFKEQVEQQVSIICPDPYFRGVDDVSGANILYETNLFGGIRKMFYFPFLEACLPEGTDTVYFGEITTGRDNKTIYYSGEADVGCVIHIYVQGLLNDDLTIYNLTENKYFILYAEKTRLLLGDYLKNGDEIYISSIQGEKSVTAIKSGLYHNLLDAINYTGDPWFTLLPGNNTFAYSAGDMETKLEFEVSSEILYNGI